jgi:hypothetical protein
MGRRPWSTRFTVEQCHRLSVSELSRGGVFHSAPGSVSTITWNTPKSSEHLELAATLKQRSQFEWLLWCVLSVTSAQGEAPPRRLEIPIVRTRCNFGGFRYWFLCPNVIDGRLICRRRVTKLFRPPGQASFGCRRCFNLTYRSVQQHDQRVDNLANDLDRLRCALTCGNLKLLPLGVKAYRKLKERLNRSPQSEQRTLSRLGKNYKFNLDG